MKPGFKRSGFFFCSLNSGGGDRFETGRELKIEQKFFDILENHKMSYGVIGNTSDFDSEESRFET